MIETIDLIPFSESPVENRLSRASYEDEDTELQDLLKRHMLENLYKKFNQLGVTADILWDLNNDFLHKNGFNEVEIIRIAKARQNYEKQSPARPGKINCMFTSGWGQFSSLTQNVHSTMSFF